MQLLISRGRVNRHFDVCFNATRGVQAGRISQAEAFEAQVSLLILLAVLPPDHIFVDDLKRAVQLFRNLEDGVFTPTPMVRETAGRLIQILHGVKRDLDTYEEVPEMGAGLQPSTGT